MKILLRLRVLQISLGCGFIFGTNVGYSALKHVPQSRVEPSAIVDAVLRRWLPPDLRGLGRAAP